jgi:MATE family multidrug resistance protein
MVFSYGIDGFAFAAESLIGKFIGANDKNQLKQAIRLIFIWGTGLGAAFSIVYLLFDHTILSLFTNQEVIVTLALSYMGWTIIAPFINSFCYIWDGIYIGATASKAMRNSMLLSTLGFFLPAYYIGHYFMGNHGMWLAMILFMIVRGVSLTLLAKKNIFNLVFQKS